MRKIKSPIRPSINSASRPTGIFTPWAKGNNSVESGMGNLLHGTTSRKGHGGKCFRHPWRGTRQWAPSDTIVTCLLIQWMGGNRITLGERPPGPRCVWHFVRSLAILRLRSGSRICGVYLIRAEARAQLKARPWRWRISMRTAPFRPWRTPPLHNNIWGGLWKTNQAAGILHLSRKPPGLNLVRTTAGQHGAETNRRSQPRIADSFPGKSLGTK